MSYESQEQKKLKDAKDKLKLWEQEQKRKEADAKLRLALWEQKEEERLAEKGHDPNWKPKSR